MVKIDMEMPKKCDDCPFIWYGSICALFAEKVKPNKKPIWCPLIEVIDGE